MNKAPKAMLLLGATSDIGRAIASAYAAAGWSIILAARDRDICERDARDLVVRYAIKVEVVEFDVCAMDTFEMFLNKLVLFPDTVVSVIGLLGDQERAEKDPAHALNIFRTNYEGPALLLQLFANRMADRGHGTIVGVSSVAGERGRASNYCYGSAKSGLTAYLSGLRSRSVKRGVHVLTVNPGYVRTKMTADMKLPGVLTAEPDVVGRAVYKAAEQKKNDVIYVLPVWRLIMAIVRIIPEGLFKRMKM